MAIPKEILAVERPKNTRVKDAGNGTYYVIARTCEYVNGRNVPKEIGRVGRIINGVYVPNPDTKDCGIDVKSYGEVALFDKVAKTLLTDLSSVFEYSDAVKLYTIALLRAKEAGIRNRDLETEYQCSFVSEMYPNVGLSENTVSAFLENIGKGMTKIVAFMQKRLDAIGSQNIVIDGMLKCNTSASNTFSEFFGKSRIKGTEDISLIYAYDTEKKEPVACMPYPGNMLDGTSFDDFIDTFKIENGFLIMDKGFSSKPLRNAIAKKGISYVVPIKTNSKAITDYNLNRKFDGFLDEQDSNIRYKKVSAENGTFYYAFHDKKIANDQGDIYINKARKKGDFDENKYECKESLFGLIVFESNKDLDAKTIYDAYKERWEIELLFKMYKSIMDRDQVNVQGDYRLYATEFINFLSAIIVCKTKKLLAEKELNKTYSYKQLMRLLSKRQKIRYISSNVSKWKDSKVLNYIQDIINILDI